MSTPSRLPHPIADAWDWQLRSRCRSTDVSTFYVPDDMSHDMRRRREVQAHAICVRCPVRPECAAYALVAGERYGVWGGFTEAERQRLVAIGWADLADRDLRRVDIAGLVSRLWNSSRSRRRTALGQRAPMTGRA